MYTRKNSFTTYAIASEMNICSYHYRTIRCFYQERISNMNYKFFDVSSSTEFHDFVCSKLIFVRIGTFIRVHTKGSITRHKAKLHGHHRNEIKIYLLRENRIGDVLWKQWKNIKTATLRPLPTCNFILSALVLVAIANAIFSEYMSLMTTYPSPSLETIFAANSIGGLSVAEAADRRARFRDECTACCGYSIRSIRPRSLFASTDS